MGFLGLGSFGTGFVKGFAESADKAIQNDIERVNDRIDKISNIRLQKRLKDEEERRDEIEDVKKALEQGTSVFGDAKYSTAMLKKFGNDLPSYKQFINEFRAAKALNPGLDTNTFFKIVGNDKTAITPTYSETQYAQSIVPPVPDYSKITKDTLGTSGTLISKLLGNKVDLLNTVNTQVQADISASLTSPTETMDIQSPQIEFDFEAYNLSKQTATEKIKYASEKILDINLVGTAEFRAANPESEKAQNYNKYVTMRRDLLTEASIVGSEEDKLEAMNQLISNAIPANFDSKEEYNEFYKNIYEERTALLDEIAFKKASASSDPTALPIYNRNELSKELATLLSKPPQGEASKEEYNTNVSKLMSEISKADINIQRIKTGKYETVAQSIDRLEGEFNSAQINSGLEFAEFIKTPKGLYLYNNLEKLANTNKELKDIIKPSYTIPELNSSISLINTLINSTLTTSPIDGLAEFTSQGGKVYSQDNLDRNEQKIIGDALKERQRAILLGGKIGGTEYPGLLNTNNAKDNPALYAAAYNLGIPLDEINKFKVTQNNINKILNNNNVNADDQNIIKNTISDGIQKLVDDNLITEEHAKILENYSFPFEDLYKEDKDDANTQTKKMLDDSTPVNYEKEKELKDKSVKLYNLKKFQKAFPVDGMDASGMVRFATNAADNFVNKEEAIAEFLEVHSTNFLTSTEFSTSEQEVETISDIVKGQGLDKKQIALFKNVMDVQYSKAEKIFKDEYPNTLVGAATLATENFSNNMSALDTIRQFKLYYPNVDEVALRETVNNIYGIVSEPTGKSAILDTFDKLQNNDSLEETSEETKTVPSDEEVEAEGFGSQLDFNLESTSMENIKKFENFIYNTYKESDSENLAQKDLTNNVIEKLKISNLVPNVGEKTYEKLANEIIKFNKNEKFGGDTFPTTENIENKVIKNNEKNNKVVEIFNILKDIKIQKPDLLRVGEDASMIGAVDVLKSKTKQKDEAVVKKTTKSNMQNVLKFENEIFEIYSKAGLQNLAEKDLTNNTIKLLSLIDANKNKLDKNEITLVEKVLDNIDKNETVRLGDAALIQNILEKNIQKFDNKRSLGERTNNAGNLKQADNNFIGEVGSETANDMEYVVFKTPAYGIRAMAVTLGTYYDDYNLQTVNDLIDRYSPINKFNTPASVNNYKEYVADKIGVERNKQINVKNPNTLFKLVNAMIEFENKGRNFYSKSLVGSAVASSFTEDDSKVEKILGDFG